MTLPGAVHSEVVVVSPPVATGVRAHFNFAAAILRRTDIAALKQMSKLPGTAVESLRIGPLKPFHSRHQIRLGRFDQQVIVIAHHHVGMHPPPGFLTNLPQRLQPEFAILVVSINRLAVVPPRTPPAVPKEAWITYSIEAKASLSEARCPSRTVRLGYPPGLGCCLDVTCALLMIDKLIGRIPHEMFSDSSIVVTPN